MPADETDKPPKHAGVPSRRKLRPRRDLDAAPTSAEIQSAVDATTYPPILDVHQAAALLQVSIHTVYRAVSEGRFKTAVRRGKPLRFWRDRLIAEFFGASPPPG
jgi:predicted DNA-binding transcriptional regulator AlpA